MECLESSALCQVIPKMSCTSVDRNLLSPLTCGDSFVHVLESTLVLMGMCVQQRLALPRVNEVFLCDVKSDRASD